MTGCSKCLRWAFMVSGWEPENAAQWLQAMESLQEEERRAAARFLFRDDMKSKVIGRLMLRQATLRILRETQSGTGVTWSGMEFGRSEKGKPYLKHPPDMGESWGVNVSHQGDWVILATSSSSLCGADVMRIEKPRGTRSVTEYLDLMSRQMSEREGLYVRGFPTDWEKMTAFYRLWCLKESYIKAIGTGIFQNLASLDFAVRSPLREGEGVTDSRLWMKGESTESLWRFEESMIDGSHCAAVCVHISDLKCCNKDAACFREVDFSDLIKDAEPLQKLNMEVEWSTFQAKSYKAKHC